MAGRFSVEAVFKAVDRVTAPISRMQNKVGKFLRRTERGMRSLSRLTNKVAGGLRKMGRMAAVGVGAIALAFAPVLKAGADFEQAITDVGAVSLQTRSEITALEQQALELGRSTKFTATEAANAMEVLARAGFNASEIMQTTPAVLSAAAASGLEIAEVADHVSNALKGMGLEMSEASSVADILALASAKTNSSIGSLGESIRNVASTARQLNIPFSQVVSSVALLQDVGLDASVAGSAFNTMLTKMAAPSAGIQKTMRRLGISFKDAEGNMLPLPAVLEQLNKAAKKMGGNFDQVAFLAELVGLRGQKAASNLADLFESGRVGDLTKDLENATGSAERMAKIRMNTTIGSLTLLGSAVDAVKVRIFNMNSGALKGLIDRMTEWVGANEKLIATKIGDWLAYIVENIGEIVEWVKKVAIGLAAFFAFNVILNTLVATMTLFNMVMAANPITWVVLAIVGLIAVLAAAVIYWDEIKAAIVGFGAAIMDKAAPAINWLKDAAETVTAAWRKAGDFIDQIIGKVSRGFDKIAAVRSDVAGFLGFGEDEDGDTRRGGPGSDMARVVSPQERTARSIEESRSTSTAEVTIRDDTGRAEVTRGRVGSGVLLQPTGGF